MFLRRHRKTVAGEHYDYWTLCETYRTERGPRQRVVASLGKLNASEVESGWDQIDDLLRGQRSERQPELKGFGGEEQQPAPHWEEVDVSGVRVERSREFGEVYLALSLWRRLGLDELVRELVGRGREEVPWDVIACLLVVARFCSRPSELSIAEGWYGRTALEDLLGVEEALINDDRLYRALDVLGEQKDKLCSHLMTRYESWFGVNFEFLLYDVTSTFFEGQAHANEKAARGYSRDNRPDCKQVCIGLVCTPEGLPLCYEVFSGNRADVTTVEDIVAAMEEKYGHANRVWVMDRGMVSEKNIDFLRARGARYLVGTPKAQLRDFEAALVEKEGWSEVQSGVEAKLLAHPDAKGSEQFVLCRSTARAEKERAMLGQQTERLCAKLAEIDASLRRQPESNLEAVGRRIGRHLGKYPAAAKVIEVSVQKDEQGKASALGFSTRVKQGRWAAHAHGAYLLRTNCTEKDPAQLWRWYIQLTQAEAAFRTAKSDLGLRPVFHQKTERVEAHILVCFLALALWRTLEMWMKSKGLGSCARKLIEEIATIKSVDVVLPVRREGITAELRLRTVTKPERQVAELLAHLDLSLPTRSKLIENVVQKNA